MIHKSLSFWWKKRTVSILFSLVFLMPSMEPFTGKGTSWLFAKYTDNCSGIQASLPPPCPGFTHSRNIMFVRKIGCYLMDTATVSQGLPTMDILLPPHWFSIQAQGRLTSAWVIRDIILTIHRTLGTEMNKEYAVRGEDAVFTLGWRKNSLRVEHPVVITWWLTCFVSVRRFENPGWKGHF